MLLTQLSANKKDFILQFLSNFALENENIDVSLLDLHHKICLLRGIVISIDDLGESHESILDFLVNSCFIEQDPCTKILCLETLGLFIKKKKFAFWQIESILQIFTKHWEDNIDAINGKVRTILANLIPEMQRSNFPLETCMQIILSMDKLSRAK